MDTVDTDPTTTYAVILSRDWQYTYPRIVPVDDTILDHLITGIVGTAQQCRDWIAGQLTDDDGYYQEGGQPTT